jgi:hypothetical protein
MFDTVRMPQPKRRYPGHKVIIPLSRPPLAELEPLLLAHFTCLRYMYSWCLKRHHRRLIQYSVPSSTLQQTARPAAPSMILWVRIDAYSGP